MMVLAKKIVAGMNDVLNIRRDLLVQIDKL